MDFRGHLRLPEDAGTGIPVLLRLDDIFVVISSGGDELGTWRADDVAIERIFSNQFAIELDGESMVFIAQDALGFAYEGVSAIEDLQERLTKRRVFKRSKKKPKQVEPASEAEPSTESPEEGAPGDETVVETAQVPAEEPIEEPAFSEEPSPIWSPPAASALPTQSGAGPEPDFDVSVPEPVKRRIDPETSAPRPDDARVSYPQSPVAPPPAVEAFNPPSTPASEIETAEPAAPPETHAAEPMPSSREGADSVEPPDTPEFEIEEVSAAASGATWADDDAVDVEPDEPEIEIEEYVLPSAGAAEMFTAPAPEIEDETTEELVSETEPERSEQPVQEPPAPEPEQPPAISAPVVEGRHVANDAEVAPADAETPAADSSAREVDVEESVGSNGHRKAARADAGERDSAKRERRHSLFGRSRDKKAPPPHDHQYGEPKTIGGLTRQVCEVCGHVTFSGEDVYQGW